ncbi:hypothetical protein GCK32_007186 [Trichostrongylus colubriformis]|uniref:Uncharacterized protein n=1 Tax=Trichostrongylus colubriformis TaxID=6319 RepID=A0AAN8J3P8_TRICO
MQYLPSSIFLLTMSVLTTRRRNGTLRMIGIKLEQFVFDVFERSKNFYIWEVEREDEFSPLKNAESAGKECLGTCKRDLASLNRKWLEAAGAIVKGDGPVFIDAFASYCGEGLDRFKDQVVTGPMLK